MRHLGVRARGNVHPRGFTIVELLIVIVVIGMLAAITIVAYNGVQQRARVASQTADLDRLGKQAMLFYAENSRYPTNNADFKTILQDANYWDVTRTTAAGAKRFIVCATDGNFAIVAMNYAGGSVEWASGADRLNWRADKGINLAHASSASTALADVCADIGLSSVTYNQWAHNLV